MKSISKLKDQARVFEQKEDWNKAIDAYVQVLQLGDQGDETDLPLYNRIGDLYVRMGRPQDAVQYYVQAADRYAEAGLFNNAIALCNKALRYVPKQWAVYRKLGQFSAKQGFTTDARRWFFEYAEQMFKTGKVDDAFSALTDFVNISDDAEIRELLGKQLNAHGRTEKALAELNRAYQMRRRAGQMAEAEAVAAQMREINPNVVLTAEAAPDRASAHDDALPGLETFEPVAAFEQEKSAGVGLDSGNIMLDAGLLETSSAPVEFDHEDVEFGEVTIASPDEEEAEEDYEDVAPLPLIDLATEDEDEPYELPTFDVEHDEDELEEEAEPLPLIDLGGADYEEEEEEEPEGGFMEIAPFEDATAEEEEVEEEEYLELPTLSLAEQAEAEAEEEEEEPEEPRPVLQPLPPAQPDPVYAAMPDAQAEIAEAREMVASGNRPGALARLKEIHLAYAANEYFEPALNVIKELQRLDPGNMRLLQQQVEYAGRLGENAPLVAALLELADHLAHSGSATKGRAVYSRVLDLDPSNKAAKAALQAEQAVAKPEADYVDLNAFLQDDDENEVTTRFVVAEKAPTGDEERDFADLLSQFKAKVAESVGPDDPASHYDLGLAFKEMGLVDEAISEFQVALKAGQEKLQVYEELGQCFMLKEQYNVAVKVLSRALQMPHADESELLGVYYHLGRCFEELGNRGEARDAYERVIGLDIQFRDVSERLARL